MARPNTITTEQARLLNQTADFMPPPGFVRAPGGWISTHAAFERTLADPDFPARNAAAVAKERFDAEADQRAVIAKTEAALAATQAAQLAKNRERNLAIQAKREREEAAYAAAQAASGQVRRV